MKKVTYAVQLEDYGNMDTKKTIKEIGTVAIICGLIFVLLYSTIFLPDFDNLGGGHIWLSGSTIKFVNQWLEEGASNLHYTCYEDYHSAEFSDLSMREPYVSYPTGSTLFVYVIARLAGVEKIGISFLKHLQWILLGLEMILFALFVYLFVSKQLIRCSSEKIFIAVSLATVWCCMPGNVWYMANVFFADQCVIFWVMLFLLLEYLTTTVVENKRSLMTIRILNAFVIYMGVLTDYYFWIMMFVTVVVHLLHHYVRHNTWKEMLVDILWYVLPSLFAVCCFLWQLSFTDGWFDMLMRKAKQRTGLTHETSIIKGLGYGFVCCFGGHSFVRGAFIGMWMCVIGLVLCRVLRSKKLQNIFADEQQMIVVVGTVSPLLQMLLLNNHSAEHEFSMLKLFWPFVMSTLLVTYWLNQSRQGKAALKEAQNSKHGRISGFACTYSKVLVCLIVVLGIPVSGMQFYDFRYEKKDYTVEKAIYRVTDDTDVCFSFSYEIPPNPPESLSVSEKRVYRITDIVEIDSYFANLDESANRLLVIDRTATCSEEVKQKEEQLMDQNAHLYDDSRFCILKLEYY